MLCHAMQVINAIDTAGLIVTENDGVIVHANERARELLGRDVPTGSCIHRVCPEVSDILASSGLERACEFTIFPQGPDDTTNGAPSARHLRVSSRPLCLHDGVPRDYVMLTFEDIAVQSTLAERIKFLSSVLDRAAGGITIIDPDLRIVYVNQAQANMHQYSVGELVGKSIDVFCDPDEIRRLQESIFATGEHEGIWTGEAVNYAKDGTAIPVLLSVSMLRDAVGKLSAIVGVTKDIHKYKELEQDMRSYSDNLARLVSLRTRELESSRDELETMFDAVSDFMFVVDSSYCITRANRFTASFFHRKRREIVGRKCYSLWGDGIEPCRGCPAHKVFGSGTTSFASRIVKEERVHVWAYPMRSVSQVADTPTLSGVLCYGKIMTAELAMEERIQQAEKMASLGQLSAGLAHELRNPLGIILAANCAVKTRVRSDDNEVHKALDTIERNVDRATGIVANLLDFSRKGTTSVATASIADLVGQVLTLEEDLLRRQRIAVSVDLDCLPPVTANSDGMRQVLFNVIHNAVQAMPDGGRLTISGRAAPSGIRLTIADTGIGIDPGELPRVFDPFFTTKAPGQGTGLGLAICYREIERHRGSISMSSRPGQGSEVTIELPLGNSAASPGSDDWRQTPSE